MPAARGGGGFAPVAPDPGLFPVRVGRRHVFNARGVPILIHGDTCWSIVGQLTNAQIDTYLNDRASRGVNTLLFSAPEAYYTNQTPSYNNVDGVAPFTTMSPVDWTSPVTAYWNRVDYLVNQAKSRGMLCIINPAYLGFQGDAGGVDGWGALGVLTASDPDLQTYGAFLANRYTQGNVIWCSGGDEAGASSTVRDKLGQILTGIRSVRTTDAGTAHPSSTEDPYTFWSGYPWFTLNNLYCYESDVGTDNYTYEAAATAYGRSLPFIGFEFRYEQEGSPAVSAAQLRRQSYGSILGGGCGQIFGNNPIWHFESSRATGFSYTGTWQSNLNSTGSQEQQYVKALFSAYQWWKLEPKTDASLVTGSLSADATRIMPALAIDGTFAMIYVPSSQTITVNTNALTGISGNVRIRRFNVTAGDYTTINASVAKTSAQSVATGAEGVIVID